jgi:oligopeptide transport system ATP-binding protein
VQAVGGVDFTLRQGEIIGMVGESGSGKSQILHALMGLLPENATTTGTIAFTGKRLAMVFQDPMTALNPYLPIGLQIAEALPDRQGRASTRARIIALLARLRIADPENRVDQYPRIVIAMALAAEPDVILADEPTTALDVTVQADILDLFRAEVRERGSSLLLVSHDLGVVAGLCDRVIVIYAGRIVEEAAVDALFAHPAHPYTKALLASVASLTGGDGALVTIPGAPPALDQPITGCAFAPRCAARISRCDTERPAFRDIATGHRAACHLAGTP